MAKALRSALTVLLPAALCWPALGLARGLVDPTLPPATPATRASEPGSEAPARAPARLQMVIRGPGETRVAVIDNRLVQVGDRVEVDSGAARVVRITDAAVTLASGDSHQTLELLPAVGSPTARRSAPKPAAAP
jgi:hypothetical protein